MEVINLCLDPLGTVVCHSVGKKRIHSFIISTAKEETWVVSGERWGIHSKEKTEVPGKQRQEEKESV